MCACASLCMQACAHFFSIFFSLVYYFVLPPFRPVPFLSSFSLSPPLHQVVLAVRLNPGQITLFPSRSPPNRLRRRFLRIPLLPQLLGAREGVSKGERRKQRARLKERERERQRREQGDSDMKMCASVSGTDDDDDDDGGGGVCI